MLLESRRGVFTGKFVRRKSFPCVKNKLDQDTNTTGHLESGISCLTFVEYFDSSVIFGLVDTGCNQEVLQLSYRPTLNMHRDMVGNKVHSQKEKNSPLEILAKASSSKFPLE